MNMRFLLLLITFSCLLPSTASFATLNSSTYHSYQPLKNSPTSTVEFAYGDIQIVEDEIVLAESWQNQLTGEIAQAQKELDRLSKSLSIKFNHDIGIVYIHRGQNHWNIKFTFGGMMLNTSEQSIFETQQIFALKKSFEQAKWIKIKGEKYATTGAMRQVGPILHSEE